MNTHKIIALLERLEDTYVRKMSAANEGITRMDVARAQALQKEIKTEAARLQQAGMLSDRARLELEAGVKRIIDGSSSSDKIIRALKASLTLVGSRKVRSPFAA